VHFNEQKLPFFVPRLLTNLSVKDKHGRHGAVAARFFPPGGTPGSTAARMAAATRESFPVRGREQAIYDHWFKMGDLKAAEGRRNPKRKRWRVPRCKKQPRSILAVTP
jgi:hypothetical protein